MTVTLVGYRGTLDKAGKPHVIAVAGEVDAAKVITAALVTGYATYVTDAATFATALGVLVADGASPTQAHVNTANSAYTTLATDWATLKALIDAANVSVGTLQTNAAVAVSVQIDKVGIPGVDSLQKIFRDIERVAVGDGNVT